MLTAAMVSRIWPCEVPVTGRFRECQVRCQGPRHGVKKPVYAYCCNDSAGLAMPKRTDVWGGYGDAGQGAMGVPRGVREDGRGARGLRPGARKPVYTYCRNDSADSATPKRTDVWGGSGHAAQDARGAPGGCGEEGSGVAGTRPGVCCTKQKPGRKRRLVCRFRPDLLGLLFRCAPPLRRFLDR